MSSLGPHDEETEAEYRARLEAMLEASALHCARNLDRLSFIEYAARTAMREGRPLDDYLPEDDPLRRQTPEHFQRMGEAVREAAETGKPLHECFRDMLQPGETPWF